jgi:hypothetical protein
MAINAFVGEDPWVCNTSANLGKTFMIAYPYTCESKYLDTSMTAFQVAVTCEFAPASERFRTAKVWAHHADLSSHESALDAYQAVMELLACLGWICNNVIWL